MTRKCVTLVVAFLFCVIAGGGDSPWHASRSGPVNMPDVLSSLGMAGVINIGRHSNENAAGITMPGTSCPSGRRNFGLISC